MQAQDPRTMVEAPVRRAMDRLTNVGIALFAGFVLVGLSSWAWGVDQGWRIVTHVAVTGLLAAFGIGVLAYRRRHGRPDEHARDEAWFRAADVDRGDARIAAIAVAAVPVATFAAMALLAWPHLLDPAYRSQEYRLWVPIFATAWAISTPTWIDMCRDYLARATADSAARFRHYWSAPQL